MRQIYLINSKAIAGVDDVETLLVNHIQYYPIKKSLLDAHISPITPQKQIDSLIFTSKHAIYALVQDIEKHPEMKSFFEIPSFVISKPSAQTLQKNGFHVEFIGRDSHGDGFSSEIIPLLAHRKPLYFRAKKIISGLDERLLEAKIPLKQIVAYENKTLSLDLAYKPKPRSVIIFTAPSNYHSFVQNFGWDGSYIAIAIGITTFGVFHREVEGYISPEQTIQSCIEFARDIISKYP
ncbi:uroporphyrinogen-III synthase [Helicobacter fennelliae]|uniref:Uroporphyrinogen-III synthase n=2 Tax=Helicobacter fennelliae TaxID=215 RepID=T1DWN6_9HELI|nr:uroporphyrinogen-III synthase [Helicobacter fennelliae]GAD19567.1 uroporphyrinogen-III synthase [Helicobacter fennelliae MRY12-0050]SQB98504.1 uroporphyrinogen-III synthase [Helicobacter fennelliae]STP07868.1 uroporphyrinogen-III synthase [Helicobacter fennelliae]STQ84248.1 uroporphyrinogen-III synthase [Helicobacter fennelliae]